MPRKTNTKKVLDHESESIPTSEAPAGPESAMAAMAPQVGQAAPEPPEPVAAWINAPVCVIQHGNAIHGPLRVPPEGDTSYDYRVGDLTFRAEHISSVRYDHVNGLTIYLNKL